MQVFSINSELKNLQREERTYNITGNKTVSLGSSVLHAVVIRSMSLACLAMCLFFAMPLLASTKKHAVLIGIGDYPTVRKLEGPLHDVELIKGALVSHWQFKQENIQTLVNEQASKKNILQAIAYPVANSMPGDTVFIYFSGHGTSAADTSLPVSMPIKTGALLPHDIAGAVTSQELHDRLLIGSRDLKPVLQQLDAAGLNVLVVVDACFSGNVIRNKKPEGALPERFVRFADLLPRQSVKAKLAERLKFNPENSYPYENVSSLSAAHEYEVAQDIPASMLHKFPTVDGKPHGAFTDSLAKVLSNYELGDLDGNQVLTLNELYESVKNLMSERAFSSTPQLLPLHRETNSFVTNRPLFGAS